MGRQPVHDLRVPERGRKVFVGIAESLFLLAFFLFCFKLFWALVRVFTFFMLDVILAWPTWLRLLVGFPLIAVPVGLVSFLVFADEERPGWLVVADLRKHPAVTSWFGLMRGATAALGSFAFLKLIWLTGEAGADAIDWWHVVGELLRRF